ncbi:hypothetical protein PMIN03_000634 [Paraphaeosphaeria minitans]
MGTTEATRSEKRHESMSTIGMTCQRYGRWVQRGRQTGHPLVCHLFCSIWDSGCLVSFLCLLQDEVEMMLRVSQVSGSRRLYLIIIIINLVLALLILWLPHSALQEIVAYIDSHMHFSAKLASHLAAPPSTLSWR